MAEIIQMPRRSLEDIAAEINAVFNDFILRTADLLLEAKEMLPHGEFIPWVEKNCPFDIRQANRYMLVGRRRDELLEPPTNLKAAYGQLTEQTQIRPRGPIWEPPTNVLTPVAKEIEHTVTLGRGIALCYRGIKEVEQSNASQVQIDALIVDCLRLIEALREFTTKMGTGTHIKAIGDYHE